MPEPMAESKPDGSVAVSEILNRVRNAELTVLDMLVDISDDYDVDPRWMAIGRADLQKGFMCICRSISSPNGD